MNADTRNGLVIEWKPAPRGELTLTARLGDDVLHVEELRIAKSRARARFIEQLTDNRPGIDRAVVEAELLRIAAESARQPAAPDPEAPELDVSCIVRPDLFHMPNVSGVTVPAARPFDGEPIGTWIVYLQWADGKRERQELDIFIEDSDGQRLWFYPRPGSPAPTMRPRWTASARNAWLVGADAPDPVDVFKRMCEQFAWFLDLPKESAAGDTALLALWTVFTYAYTAWAAVPYLNVGGPLGSGKTALLAVLARVVHRPMQSSNMTAPCLFRTLHEHGGTLLLDEAERLRDVSPEAGELRSILMSGYKRGSPARRLEKVGDAFQQVSFDVFGPKVIAGIANLPEALASRCIRLTMFRAAPASPKPRRRLDENPATWMDLRDDLHALALEHGPTWNQLAGRADVCPVMSGRDFELWQPLLALAAWLDESGATGLLGVMQEYAKRVIAESHDDATPDTDESLLRLLADSVKAGTHGSLTPGEVLRRAKELDPVTFKRWKARGVSAALKRYGLKTHKTAGRPVYGRVTVDALRRIERNYLIDLGLPANVPDVPYVPLTGGDDQESGVKQGTLGD